MKVLMYYGYGYGYYNSAYMIGYVLIGIGALIMMFAQAKVTSAFNKYSKVENQRHLTGKDVAQAILQENGIGYIPVQQVSGRLSDHYNPSKKTLNLSDDIYNGHSIAALAVAAHECGHALQDKEGYAPLRVRNSIVSLCNVSQYIGWAMIMLGLALGHTTIAWVGVLVMGIMLVFQLITLPVEFDASARALSILKDRYLVDGEYDGAKKMLTAAALTYVAATLSTLLSLLRIVLIVASRDRD